MPQLVKQEKDHGRYERDKAFLRGGIWKNFLSRYAESNWMHKRMLALSGRAAPSLPPQQRDGEHDRAAVSGAGQRRVLAWIVRRALPAASAALRCTTPCVALEAAPGSTAAARAAVEQRDLDLGWACRRFSCRTASCRQWCATTATPLSIELDSYSLGHNFGDTLRRRDEHYYRQAGAWASSAQAQAWRHRFGARSRAPQACDLRRPTSSPMYAPRGLFVDSWAADPYRRRACRHGYEAQADGRGSRWIFAHACRRVRCSSRLRCRQPRDGALSRRRGAGWPFRTQHQSRDAELRRCARALRARRAASRAASASRSKSMRSLPRARRRRLGRLRCSCCAVRPRACLARPHFTVSQSEDGFEKVMQAVTLDLSWAVGEGTDEWIVALEIQRQA